MFHYDGLISILRGMTGTLLNCAGILIGAILGKFLKKTPGRPTEAYIRIILAAFIMFYGLRLTWISVHGSFIRVVGQLLLVIVALSLGKMTGSLLRLQKLSNRLGQFARERMGGNGGATASERFNNGFLACTALFCAAPLSIAGAIQDGLSGYYYPLAAKAVIEGLAVFGLVRALGWGVALSFLPVLAFQGTITLLVRLAEPALSSRDLVDPTNAVGGLLVFSVALVMLELKKLHLADYLPSLLIAPLLAWALKAF